MSRVELSPGARGEEEEGKSLGGNEDPRIGGVAGKVAVA